jgi:hypothetical protein
MSNIYMYTIGYSIFAIKCSRLGAEIHGRSGHWNHKIILFWPNLAWMTLARIVTYICHRQSVRGLDSIHVHDHAHLFFFKYFFFLLIKYFFIQNVFKIFYFQ